MYIYQSLTNYVTIHPPLKGLIRSWLNKWLTRGELKILSSLVTTNSMFGVNYEDVKFTY